VHIELEAPGRQEPIPEGFSWNMMDKEREAVHLWCPASMNATEEVDRQFDLLIGELQRIVIQSPDESRIMAGPTHGGIAR
jgi:hypothetical protein